MRQRLIWSKVGAAVFALAGAVTPASAQHTPPVGVPIMRAARPIIVLESYIGQRPANAGVIVGMVRLEDKPGVIGSLSDAAGNVVRSAIVTLEGGDEIELRSLTRFLARELADDRLSVAQLTTPSAGTPSPAAGLSSGCVPQLLAGAGAAALVTGEVLYAIDQGPRSGTSYLYRNTAPAGVAVGSVGIAAVSLRLWLWVARNGRLSAPTFAIGPSSDFVGWAGEL